MRVLIVEDDVRLRGMLRDFLREEGFAVDEAADGGEALTRRSAGTTAPSCSMS